MSQPLLSILIPTVVGREDNCTKLLRRLLASRLEDVGQGWVGKDERLWGIDVGGLQIIGCKDSKEMTIGEKRELLYQKADGLFSWQIDDDDDISDDAVDSILDQIRLTGSYIDCITFEENCMMNGQYYSCRHSLEYDDWRDNFDGYDFVRTPFYKDVIKTEIAKSVPFEHIRYGEDHAWSRALKPHLKNEIHIPRELYFYIHNSKPEEHNERYGIT
jgi:hypothetical protein